MCWDSNFALEKKPLDPHILDNYWTLYLPKAL